MKRLLTTVAIATAMLAIAAATASADTLVYSASNYEVSAGPSSTQVTVNAGYSIADFEGNASVTQFVVAAWASDCSSDDFYGDFGDSAVYTVPDQADGSASATFDVAKQTNYCVGSYFSVDGTAVLIAQPLYFDQARVEYQDDYSYPRSLGFALSVDPGWLQTNYSLKYFKKVNTDQCDSPDAADLQTAQTTAPTWVWNYASPEDTYQEIYGLQLETQYCVAFLAENVAGSNGEHYFGFETQGDSPDIPTHSYRPSTSRIDFSADITPNSARSNAHVEVEYFAKDGDQNCGDYEGPMHSYSYYGPGGNSPTGFDTTNMSSSIEDLDPGTYCLRVVGVNDYGARATDWSAVTMASKAASSVEDVKFTGTNLSFALNDRGGLFDTRNYSVAGVTLFQTNPEYCNDDYYAAGTEMLTSNFEYGDESEYVYNIGDLVPGQNYCFHAFLYSTWEGFNTTYSKNIVYGLAPEFSDVNTSHTTTSIKIDANLNPGSLETGYSANYFAKDGDEACEDHDADGLSAGGGNLTEDLGQAAPVSVEVSDLTPDTDYCLRLVADNSADSAKTAFHVVHTDPDTADPSKPSGLVASNITKTSATLSWDASSDNVGVDGYVIYKDGDDLPDTAGTSIQVPLTCGQASSFTIQAFDSAGNYSDVSEALVITGAACDPEAPSAPTGLVASNVTQTSATLSWTAATDNVGVTGYKIYKNIVFVGDSSGTSTTVSVSCGQSALFAVKALDAAGNLSAASLPVQIVGAPCDVPTPPAGGGTTPPPPAKQCFAAVKKQSFSGKVKKKSFKVSLSGVVAADGQSIQLVVAAPKTVSTTLKIDDKKAKGPKVLILLTDGAQNATLKIKYGKKSKILKLPIARRDC